MRKVFLSFLLGIVLSGVAFVASGCLSPGPFAKESAAQPGETAAEGNRRHIRNARTDQQGMNQDFDAFWLTDKPSKQSTFKMK